MHQRARAGAAAQQQHAEPPTWRAFLQLLPLLFLLVALLFNGFASAAPFSLQRTSSFPVQRVTENLDVRLPYFVPHKFDASPGNVARVDTQVFQAYREECANEIHMLRRLMRRDWFGRWHHTARSQAYRTPFCDALGVDAAQQ